MMAEMAMAAEKEADKTKLYYVEISIERGLISSGSTYLGPEGEITTADVDPGEPRDGHGRPSVREAY